MKFVHIKPNNYKCDICHKTFHMLFQLKKHLRIEHGDKKLSCFLCDKEFNSYSVSDYHKKTVHEKLFGCASCLMAFQDEEKYLSHIKFHRKTLNLKSFKCHSCQKEYVSSKWYKNHITICQNQKGNTNPINAN